MQNIAINMCEKFHNDLLRKDIALVLWKSDNNNPKKDNKNNVGSAWGPVSGYKMHHHHHHPIIQRVTSKPSNGTESDAKCLYTTEQKPFTNVAT